MTNFELINTIIEDADHIKLSEYNIRYLTLANAEGVFDKEIYDRMRDIDSGGFGYAFEAIQKSTTMADDIKTQMLIIALRAAKMPIIFKRDRDTKYFLLQAGAEHISEFIDSNIDMLVEKCKNFKGIESDEACRYFLTLLSKWFLSKDITDADVAQLFNYNIFNSMIAIHQVSDVSVLDVSQFEIKLSTASDPEFNGLLIGKIIQKILGNNGYVYEARLTKDYALCISYYLKNKEYNGNLFYASAPAHGVDSSKGCYCVEQKFNSVDELKGFLNRVNEDGVVKNIDSLVSYSIVDTLIAKYPKAVISRDYVKYGKLEFSKPEYTVNTNRDAIKRAFNTILFKMIDDMIC